MSIIAPFGRYGALVAAVALAASCGGGGGSESVGSGGAESEDGRGAANLVDDLSTEFADAIRKLDKGDAALPTNAEQAMSFYDRAVDVLESMAENLDEAREVFPAADARVISNTAQDLRATREPYVDLNDCALRSGSNACSVELGAFVAAARSAGTAMGQLVTEYGGATSRQEARDSAEGRGSGRTATVQQVASVVAENRPDVEASLLDYESARTSQLLLGRCDPIQCQLPILTLVTVAQTMRLTLDAIDNDQPQNQLFIGAVPSELEGIVEDTLGALSQTISAGQAYRTCVTNDPSQYTCGLLDLISATSSLQRQLAGWDPYL